MPKPTGNAEMPPDVLRAKDIFKEINGSVDAGVLNDLENQSDQGNDSSGNEEPENRSVAHPAKRAAAVTRPTAAQEARSLIHMLSSQLDPKAVKIRTEEKEERRASQSRELAEVILQQSADRNMREMLRELREEVRYWRERFDQTQRELHEANMDRQMLRMQIQMFSQHGGGFMGGSQFFPDEQAYGNVANYQL
jgi:6-pyruvoyl-tetrahydropterin synthase